MSSGRITRNAVPALCRLVWGPLWSSLQPKAIATSGVYELRVRGVLLPDLPPMDVLIRRLRLHELVDIERRRGHLTLRMRVVGPWGCVDDVERLVVVVAIDFV